MSRGRAASIHTRLLALARQRGEEFNRVLNRYTAERWLYRLSSTRGRDRLWLKGALLFDLWFDGPQRPTRDVDLLGVMGVEEELIDLVREACAVEADDGMEFDAETVRAREVREHANYGGVRVKLMGRLGNARCPLQIDVGFGDVVTPGPSEATYPTLLEGLPAPLLKVYPRATVIAEKVEAIVTLGMANSRMKDYYDLALLAREGAVDPSLLAEAIRSTFNRRGTALPDEVPPGLSASFSADALTRDRWRTFLAKNGLAADDLEPVVDRIREFVVEPLRMARQAQP